MRTIPILLLSLTLTLASCAMDRSAPGVELETAVTEPTPAPAPAAPATPAPTSLAPPLAQPTLNECAPTLAWWKELPSWSVTPAAMGVSPNGGLLLRSTQWDGDASVFLRLEDGEPVVGAPFMPGPSLDAGWHLRVDLDDTSTKVRVSTVVTSAVLRTFQPPAPTAGWSQVVRPAITPDGTRVVALTCETSPMGDQHFATLTSWHTDSGAPGYTFTLDVQCGWWPELPLVVPTAAGSGVLVTSQDKPSITFMDLESGGSWSHTFDVGEDDPNMWFYGSPIVNLVTSPDGKRVALVTRDSKLHLLSLPTLEQLAEPTSAGVVGINLNTYMPSGAAPLAWSPDGALLAHVDAEGRIVLRRVDDPGLLMTFEAPALAQADEAVEPGWVHNAPVSVTFLPDASGLAISYEQGVALWRCPGAAWPEGDGPLDLLIEGPKTLKVGQPGTWTATHLGTDDVHSHTLLVDGAAVTAPSMDRNGTWTPLAPGTYTMSMVIDDGLSTGVASMELTVTP